MQSVIIGPNEAGQRFDKFLHKYLPNASTSFLYKMLRKKNITLNGKKAEGNEILKLSDEVKVFFAEDTFLKFTGKEAVDSDDTSSADISMYRKAYQILKEIQIIYEDSHILILNKPVGILTQKAEPKDLSLNEWMIGYLLKTNAITAKELATFKPSVVNRLDRNTSGLVLCGKSLAGSQALSRLIRKREVKKFYRTVVLGRLTKPKRINGYLLKDEKNNKVTVSKTQGQVQGDAIETAYTPLAVADKTTYLEVELITGKTHQIRAHLSNIGHPLAGDPKYGNKKENIFFQTHYKLNSQLLHAYRLEFPKLEGTLSTVSEMIFTAPLPASFEAIVKDHFKNYQEE